MLRSQKGLPGAGEWHQFKNLFPNLISKKVLDLGCGYGWHCKYAVECGAEQVLGIDISKKMIQEAIVKNADTRITFQVCDLEEYDYPNESYDCVISNLVLHYISDIDRIYKKIYSTLKKDGVFLLNIEHPVFTSGVNQDWIYNNDNKAKYWPIDNYFYPGERETRFLGQYIKKYHHTITQIVMGLRKIGFTLDVIEEAVPEYSVMDQPGMSDEMRRPMMLLIKAIK